MIASLDIETTDLHWEKGARITELSLVVLDESVGVKRHFTSRFNPGRDVSAEAERITGLSLSVLSHEPAFVTVAPTIVKILGSMDLIIGHNGIAFDFPFLENELLISGYKWDWRHRKVFDTMLNGRWATPNGKLPNLEELCWSLDVPYDTTQAHGAYYDANVTLDAYLRGRSLKFFNAESTHVD